MSSSSVPYPIVGAVKGVERILGPGLLWSASSAEQERFLKQYFLPCADESTSLPDIETLASWSDAEINAFLKKKGFSIQLDPFQPHEFGVACVLDVLVKWIEAATKRPIVHDKTKYPGVRMTKNVEYLMSPLHGEAIARITTANGDVVCMTMLDNAPTGFDLESGAKELSVTARHSASMFGGLRFPMVDLNQETDISWLKKMSTTALGEAWEISQALQQNKLRMNHLGARAQSAVAIGGMMITSVRPPDPPDLVIDRPFLTWFERTSVSRPLFVAHVTPDDWKEPADIDTP